jgi:hypothetical protein
LAQPVLTTGEELFLCGRHKDGTEEFSGVQCSWFLSENERRDRLQQQMKDFFGEKKKAVWGHAGGPGNWWSMGQVGDWVL